jgi:hypothetical protein
MNVSQVNRILLWLYMHNRVKERGDTDKWGQFYCPICMASELACLPYVQ